MKLLIFTFMTNIPYRKTYTVMALKLILQAVRIVIGLNVYIFHGVKISNFRK